MNAQITYLGAATALLEVGPFRLLTDPALDPAGSYRGAKLIGPPIPPDRMGRIDAVLLSHDQHGDNLDRAGRALLPQAGRVLTTTAGGVRLGGNALGLRPWQSTELVAPGGLTIRVTATPARHGPAEVAAAFGEVTGFVLEWEDQQHDVLYISGDTTWQEAVEEVGRRFDVGTAIVHLGAVLLGDGSPTLITFDGAGGARAARALDAHTVIPIHYEGWTHFRDSRDEIMDAFEKAGLGDRVKWLPLGKAVRLEG